MNELIEVHYMNVCLTVWKGPHTLILRAGKMDVIILVGSRM